MVWTRPCRGQGIQMTRSSPDPPTKSCSPSFTSCTVRGDKRGLQERNRPTHGSPGRSTSGDTAGRPDYGLGSTGLLPCHVPPVRGASSDLSDWCEPAGDEQVHESVHPLRTQVDLVVLYVS